VLGMKNTKDPRMLLSKSFGKAKPLYIIQNMIGHLVLRCSSVLFSNQSSVGSLFLKIESCLNFQIEVSWAFNIFLTNLSVPAEIRQRII
jgi:hypothetical protein